MNQLVILCARMLVQNSYGIGGTLRNFALVIGELQLKKILFYLFDSFFLIPIYIFSLRILLNLTFVIMWYSNLSKQVMMFANCFDALGINNILSISYIDNWGILRDSLVRWRKWKICGIWKDTSYEIFFVSKIEEPLSP